HPRRTWRALPLLPGIAPRYWLGIAFSLCIPPFDTADAFMVPPSVAMADLVTHENVGRCALIFPPPLKSCRSQLGITDRVLYVLVAEIVLQRSRIPPGIRLVESTGVSEHVRVSLDSEPGGLASPVNELLKVGHGHRRSAFGQE